MKETIKNIFTVDDNDLGTFVFMWLGIIMSILGIGLIIYGAITGQLVVQ